MSEGGQRELVALMASVAAGDRAAFKVLYERTSSKLFSSIRRILVNQAAAEDAVQDAYVKIWRRAGDFDASVASPIAWMTTIARHAAIDVVRRGAERISAAGDEIDTELADRLADPAGSGERLVAGTGLRSCLDKLDVRSARDGPACLLLRLEPRGARQAIRPAGCDREDASQAEPDRIEGLPRWLTPTTSKPSPASTCSERSTPTSGVPRKRA